MNNNIAQFTSENYLNIETFRKNGQGVKTPVWFVQDGETFYVRTIAGSGKVKRVRNNGKARIVPCEANGTPHGEWVTVHASEDTSENTAEMVRRLLEKKYGAVQVRAFAAATALRGDKYTVLEIDLRQKGTSQ